MKGFRFTIKRKILFGFLLIVLLIAGNGIYTITTIYNVDSNIKEAVSFTNPLDEEVVNFISLVNKSKMLGTNWVYLQTNTTDKDALRELHQNEYPELKNRINDLISTREDTTLEVRFDSLFTKFEEIIEVEKEIMTELVTFEDYEDPIKKFMAEEKVSEGIIPLSADLISDLEAVRNETQKEKLEKERNNLANLESLQLWVVILSSAIVAISLVIAFLISTAITRPLKKLRHTVDRIGEGELVSNDNMRLSNDELGDMASSVNKMAKGYGEIATFAENIGNGKYDVEFKPLSDKDVLGNALLDMRDNLKKVAEEDKKRNWATSGMAKFGEILRNYSNDYEKLSDEIISNLVKYIEANQGALFIIAESAEGEDDRDYMELAACYAWNKKKFVDKKIFKGEGLAGQAWLEGDTIYLTDIPDDYINITSGLGSANPKSILIVPLKVNEEIHGVMEIASFEEFKDFEIEFVERISESIASTISSVKVNERTQKLLKESTMMTEQMRAQEEEMRQNMEELQATQEKIQRDQQERDARERIIMDSSMVFELSTNFNVIKATEVVRKQLGYGPDQLEGKAFKDLLDNAAVLKEISDNATEHSTWNGILEMKDKSGNKVKVWGSAGQVPDSINEGNIYVLYLIDISRMN